MKIRIVTDAKMINIAALKIAGYYKNDDVGFYNPIIDVKDTDICYVSQIFKDSVFDYLPNCDTVWGGSGHNVKKCLPNYLENADVDYSIYPECNYSMQFYSRGCTEKCPFCIVPEKEGYIYPTEPMSLNPNGKHIEILDNNFFANPEWKSACEHILTLNQPVNFHGIKVQTLNDENCYYLNKIKRHKQIKIAWDNPKIDMLPIFKDLIKWIRPYKLMCYVLIGYWSTPDEDLYRIEKLRELKIDPFIMPFDKTDKYQRSFARWVNHKAIFKTVKWEDYKK